MFEWSEPVIQAQEAKSNLATAKSLKDAVAHGQPQKVAPGAGGAALDLVMSPVLRAVVQAGLMAGFRQYLAEQIKLWPRYPFRG